MASTAASSTASLAEASFVGLAGAARATRALEAAAEMEGAGDADVEADLAVPKRAAEEAGTAVRRG